MDTDGVGWHGWRRCSAVRQAAAARDGRTQVTKRPARARPGVRMRQRAAVPTQSLHMMRYNVCSADFDLPGFAVSCQPILVCVVQNSNARNDKTTPSGEQKGMHDDSSSASSSSGNTLVAHNPWYQFDSRAGSGFKTGSLHSWQYTNFAVHVPCVQRRPGCSLFMPVVHTPRGLPRTTSGGGFLKCSC